MEARSLSSADAAFNGGCHYLAISKSSLEWSAQPTELKGKKVERVSLVVLKAVFHCVASHVPMDAPNGTWKLSIATICEETGAGKSAVSKALKHLHSRGYITRKARFYNGERDWSEFGLTPKVFDEYASSKSGSRIRVVREPDSGSSGSRTVTKSSKTKSPIPNMRQPVAAHTETRDVAKLVRKAADQEWSRTNYQEKDQRAMEVAEEIIARGQVSTLTSYLKQQLAEHKQGVARLDHLPLLMEQRARAPGYAQDFRAWYKYLDDNNLHGYV